MSGLIGAVQFLTRVSIRTRSAIPHARIVPWFPVAGSLIGLAVAGVAASLAAIGPHPVAASVAVVVGLLATGAFHEDGLADVADAFGGGWTREQRFEILKDSRHGTYGVVALAASIVLRAVAAGSIMSTASLAAGLFTAHVLGRTAIIAAMAVAPPAADSGLGAAAARGLRRLPTTAALLTGLVATTFATGWWAGPLVAAGAAGVAATTWLAVRKIGGLTGDVLGAVEQVVECTTLVTVSILAAHRGVWWA